MRPIFLNLNHRLLPTTSQVSPSANHGQPRRSCAVALPDGRIPAMLISRGNSDLMKALRISNLFFRYLLVREPVLVTGIRKLKAANSDENLPVGRRKEGEDGKKKKKKGEEEEEGEGLRMLQPPEKPVPGDCCGSGCVRCVWDVYYDELKAYEDLRKGFGSDDPDRS